MNDKSLPFKVVSIILILVGGLAFLWLVVLRALAKLHGGAPCPYALAWIVDNPIRRRYLARVLDWVGIQPGGMLSITEEFLDPDYPRGAHDHPLGQGSRTCGRSMGRSHLRCISLSPRALQHLLNCP